MDDRKVWSCSIHVLRHSLRWVDARLPVVPHKTLYNRFRRWSDQSMPST